MRALVAFDKFKHALTARAACDAAADALRARHPDWELDLCPLTDGGEGFCETLTRAAAGQSKIKLVSGPLSTPVHASIGYIQSDQLTAGSRNRLRLGTGSSLAVLGLASASGLELVPRARQDPWQTTTVGTGELVAAARGNNVAAILLGVGGSATNDLGLGALAALGFRFLDAAGTAIAVPTPATWENIHRIDSSGAMKLPPLFIACDVTNPLLGPTGATATFGPQKGLKPADLPRLEAQAERMAELLCQACNKPFSLAETPGAGTAGGIAFGLMVAAEAELVSGFDLVSEWLDLPERIQNAVHMGWIPASSAHELARIDDPDRQRDLADQVSAGGLNRAAVRAAAGRSRTPAAAPLRHVYRTSVGRVTIVIDRAAASNPYALYTAAAELAEIVAGVAEERS